MSTIYRRPRHQELEERLGGDVARRYTASKPPYQACDDSCPRPQTSCFLSSRAAGGLRIPMRHCSSVLQEVFDWCSALWTGDGYR